MSSDKPISSSPYGFWFIVSGGLIAATVAFAVFSTDRYNVIVLGWIAINTLLAASLRFVTLIGEINMACAAFLGIGAYASAIATVMFGLPLPIAIFVGAAAGAITSAIFGYLTLRTKGAYFLLIGFAFTEVTRLLYTQIEAIGGNSGIVGIFPPMVLDRWYPAITVTLTAVALVVLYAVERSTLGKVFLAIRGNERIVLAAGINVLGVKIACLVIASFMAGLAGALQAHAANVISPGDFGYVVAAFALASVKIGGEGNILGTVLGAAGLTIIDQYVRGFGVLEYILFGGAIVAAMLFLPDGLYGIVQRAAVRWLPDFRPSSDKRRTSP